MNAIKWVSIIFCLLQASAGHADWCDGRKFMLLAMPMSERVLKAGDSLQQLQQSLAEEAGRLQLDIQQNSLSVKSALSTELNLLKHQTIELCEQGQSGKFPVQYQSVFLADPLELRAQVSLNLTLLTAQQAASGDMEKVLEEIGQSTKAMRQKSRELALLVKHHAVQVENPGYNRQFIQAACIAAEDSHNLLKSWQTDSLDTLLAEKIQQLKQPIDTSKLEKFLTTCRHEGDPETFTGSLRGMLNRLKSGF
jgi:hypothetical protein